MRKHSIVVTRDGIVQYTRSSKINFLFDGRGNMQRVSDIHKGFITNRYYIYWLKGPNADRYHTYGMSMALGLISTCPGEWMRMPFHTYEEAVEHEIAVIDCMRKSGIIF